jgi:hypothetical protein
MAIAAAHAIPSSILQSDAWAGSREAERVRTPSQQQATEQAREQAQQSTERSGEQARQSTERSQDDDRSQGAPTSLRDQDAGQERGGTREDAGAAKSASQPSRRVRDERDGNQRAQDDDGPPKTVLELIQRLTTPKRPATPSHKGQIGDLGSHSTLASSEILAVGLNPAGRARARALGFTLGHSQQAGVRNLMPPPGFDAVSALDLLRSQLPADRFGLNYAYRPYRSATGVEGGATRGDRKASIGGCDASRCYGPATIGWEPRMRTCARNVRIGIIDTSIDHDHPAFKGRTIEIGNFLPSGVARTINWHGTGVLALLAGNPNSGTPGLVPDAHFFAADVYHADEGGLPVADTLSLLRAMDWMRASKVDVINMSMSGPPDELLQKAIADMSAGGVVFVAAAGNGGPSAPPSYPAAYEQVIAVTAVDKNLRGYIHANHGDYIDVAAPGVGIWTALPNVLEGYQSGTSFAAPHVTAILAAVHDRVQDKSKEGFLRALAIRDLGQAGRDRIYGRGLVMAPNACSSVEEPSGWVTDVVRAPAMPSPPIPSSLTSSFR